MGTFAVVLMYLLWLASTVFSQEYKHLGCFRDTRKRAIPFLMSKLPKKDTPHQRVTACARLTKAKGYAIFSVQYSIECFSGPNAEHTYDRYGSTDGCKDGIGGRWAADVYTFKVARHLVLLPPTKNKALVNHVIEEQVLEKDMCSVLCYLNHDCVSFNLGPSSTPGMMVCQLNDADRYQYPQDYQDTPGHSYVGNKENYYT